MKSVGEALRWSETLFSQNRFEAPEVEARALLGSLLGLSSADLFLGRDTVLSDDHLRRFELGVARRLSHEPAAFIAGTKNFRGRDFFVDRRVLIPRPETELLVEAAKRMLLSRPADRRRILDVGTGSGCIAVSLALEVPASEVLAVDISLDALAVAQANAHHFKTRNVRFFQSDLYAGLSTGKERVFDMIVANPPYIATPELAALERDLSYEPALALDGGDDGLRVIKPLVSDAPQWLVKGGVLVMEIGYNQALASELLFNQCGFGGIEITKDFGGHDRIIKGELSGSI